MNRLARAHAALLCSVSLAPGLCHSAQAQAPRALDASFGVWPWLVGNVDRYQTEIINRAKSTGLDTIYMHVWRTTGSKKGELHIVDEAGTWSSANGRLIPQVTLGSFTRKAHAAGIQVVGVVQVFRSPGPAPSDFGHQDFLIEKVIRYLVHSYDGKGQRVYPLDGIALDYIRWFGGNHTTTPVNRFIDKVREEVGVLPIHAYVIAGAYALDGGSYNNTFRSYNGLLAYVGKNFGQHWEQMATRVDVLMPMTYTALGHVYGNNIGYMEGYVRQATKYARAAVRAARSRCRVVPAIRTWNSSGQTTTQATVEACCRGAMAGGADGFMAFRYFTARNHNSWFNGLARYSQPGQDLPVADLSMRQSGQKVVVDTSRCFHTKFGSNLLQVRLDLDGDGRFETGPQAPGVRAMILSRPGLRFASAEVTDPKGQRAYATVRFDTPDILSVLAASVSLSKGGSVPMRLLPGPALSGTGYIVFASLAGTEPGTPVGANLIVPLKADAVTTIVYGARNTSMFPNFSGTINAFGLATPRFVLPANALQQFWAGARIYFAAVGFDRSTGAPVFTSNPVTVTFVR